MTPKQIDLLKRAVQLIAVVGDSIQKAKLTKATLNEARELIVDALDEETPSERA